MSKRSWRTAFAALAALLLPALGMAAEARSCTPEIRVHTTPLQFRHISTENILGVTAINQQSSHPLTRQGYGLGSTFARSGVNATWREGSGGCPSLELTVGYPVMDVYVASELRQNSCAYDHVYRHEMVHVDIYRRWLAQMPARLSSLITQRYGELRSMPAQARVDATLALAMQEMRLVRQQHSDFDSHEEYGTNSTACGAFIPKLLARMKQEGRLQ